MGICIKIQQYFFTEFYYYHHYYGLLRFIMQQYLHRYEHTYGVLLVLFQHFCGCKFKFCFYDKFLIGIVLYYTPAT